MANLLFLLAILNGASETNLVPRDPRFTEKKNPGNEARAKRERARKSPVARTVLLAGGVLAGMMTGSTVFEKTGDYS